ncbi:Inorganic polyphosphate/ATP-NAD kinase [Corynebacterium glaucum]|uniref:NAD kinase n=1 Tax=Corynebacterium glaucum TaxID=187491 RepID=A0A1Q2HWH0_9CORY|nr:NAD kinase [Corynebacterium glaucum]AQQ15188.1 Inorganic polyphosphate/ATP-NAD kinase [Corynebacterium glaucum]WJZ07685.1 Inorganic polyphosphate/ATP-NAD kinase [Corynebacterium glaucum]
MADAMTDREILLVPHFYRPDNIASASKAASLLEDAGIRVRLLDQGEPGSEQPIDKDPVLNQLERVAPDSQAAAGCELVLVLGGDGTFLRAAAVAREQDLPVLGINLGHVGFLAEGEAESLETAIAHVIDRTYFVEDRMTIDVQVLDAEGKPIETSWALNECSVENTDRTRVLDAILEVDFRPVSSFGCDGVLISTPTGSTAYAFSAGGPVMWPALDAILVVPNNAHALFAKPMVVSPRSTVAVESEPTTGRAVAVMDGFRRIEMPPGSRVEVIRGHRPVKWVRLDKRPFTDRLVRKFQLPVSGWRGPRYK